MTSSLNVQTYGRETEELTMGMTNTEGISPESETSATETTDEKGEKTLDSLLLLGQQDRDHFIHVRATKTE